MEKATIYDYARMCKAFKNNCGICPMSIGNNGPNKLCAKLVRKFPDKANEIILKWCKEHPVETKQSKVQKIIPKLVLDVSRKYVDICPNDIDEDFNCKRLCDNYTECEDCKKEYWLAEVDENE